MINDIQKAKSLFTAMVKMESAMALYYRECSKTYAEEYEFFNDIEKQELVHQHDLLFIFEEIERNPEAFTWNMYFDESVVNAEADKMIDKAKFIHKGMLGIEDALRFALTQENTVMEKHYTEIVTCEDTLINDMMKKIADETELHFNSIEEKLKEKTK